MVDESQGDNRVVNPRGLYRHEGSGATEIAVNPIQGDAFVRLGYVYVGPADSAPVATEEAPASDDRSFMDRVLHPQAPATEEAPVEPEPEVDAEPQPEEQPAE